MGSEPLDLGDGYQTTIEDVDTLPRSGSNRDTWDRSLYYGVLIEGRAIRQVGIGGWILFRDLEPALAFGRAARMSMDVTGYRVARVVLEEKHHPGRRLPTRVLYVERGSTLDRQDGELDALRRWVDGISPTSSHWHGNCKTPCDNPYCVKAVRVSA